MGKKIQHLLVLPGGPSGCEQRVVFEIETVDITHERRVQDYLVDELRMIGFPCDLKSSMTIKCKVVSHEINCTTKKRK